MKAEILTGDKLDAAIKFANSEHPTWKYRRGTRLSKGHECGRLTAIGNSFPAGKPRLSHTLCKCACGNVVIILTRSLVAARPTISCGCFLNEAPKTHGKHGTPIYRIWIGMKQRCSDPNMDSYPRYGGRGITVCERWARSFENFFEDMGDRPPGMSIERIDNDKGYSPENCKWATVNEQARNKSKTRLITIDGMTLCVTDWAIKKDISLSSILQRIKKGFSPQDAVMTPIAPRYYRRKRLRPIQSQAMEQL